MSNSVPGKREQVEEVQPKYTIVSLFCGAGGLDLGFHTQGFRTIWANDFNETATKTMRTWCRGAKVVHGDITKISSLLIPKADVMLGGFPCRATRC